MFILHRTILSYYRRIAVSPYRLIVVMSSVAAPESVTVAIPVEPASSGYWPLTLDEVRDCDLSYFNDKWSEDMIKDGMCAILIANALPEVTIKEINVWLVF